MGRWTLDSSPAFLALDLAARLVSPYDAIPLGFNPLADILDATVDFGRLARSPVKLFVTATNVRTGQGRIFRNAEVTPDVLLASACPSCSRRSRSTASTTGTAATWVIPQSSRSSIIARRATCSS